ncbi:hypothetical protein H2O64_01720 [Kordia sp. YSTF-M3]|uniref:Uncharacterized protein n=1 Tax=Kordia aestuariivivens TaxID=2759037 RepID=A0ABR7Q475_9FLAO|nr:DUF6090 family protein [Kordia aestuariivivens]MBC8753369.1 hypothetical protein [Kordia aestuariivivens]
MISTSKIRTYLNSALGEILKVVIGILIALQVNTWVEQAKENTEELRILQNLKQDLLSDISQLERDVESGQNRQHKIDSIFDILYKPKDYNTTKFLRLNFALADENHFDLNSGTFDESMASGTIKTIRNNSIRQQIFNYYRITKKNYTDNNTVKQIYETIFPQFFKTLVPSQEFIGGFLNKSTHLPNLDIETLALDKEYIGVLTLKHRTEYHQILSWKEYVKLARSLLDDLEKELEDK